MMEFARFEFESLPPAVEELRQLLESEITAYDEKLAAHIRRLRAREDAKGISRAMLDGEQALAPIMAQSLRIADMRVPCRFFIDKIDPEQVTFSIDLVPNSNRDGGPTG